MTGPETDELIQHIAVGVTSVVTAVTALIIALRKVKQVNGKLDKHIHGPDGEDE